MDGTVENEVKAHKNSCSARSSPKKGTAEPAEAVETKGGKGKHKGEYGLKKTMPAAKD